MHPGLTASIGLTACSVVAADFGFILSHRMRHRYQVLWEFHKVHHSATVLTPITADRTHPVDLLFAALVVGVVTGIVSGAARYAFIGKVEALTILGTNAVGFLFTAAGSHLRHSHIWWSWGPILSRIFISPARHQVHHSVEPRHLHRNLGGMLAVWDWMAGSLHIPGSNENFSIGLGAIEDRDYASPRDLYTRPFRKIFRRQPSSK